MYEIEAPTGRPILIPDDVSEDAPYFSTVTAEAAEYYRREGYLVLRGATPKALCAEIRGAFAAEVTPHKGRIYRQASARAERNAFNAFGHVMNPIQNPQDLDQRVFPRLRAAALDALTTPVLIEGFTALFEERPAIAQSLYLHGSSETWPQQDARGGDAKQASAWLALEDICPSAGRFYVCPGSHRLDPTANRGDNAGRELARHACLKAIEQNKLEIRAPALGEGDLLICNAKTMHGTLRTMELTRTRQALTANFIPESHCTAPLQMTIDPRRLRRHRGVLIHCPKDQTRAINRVLLWLGDRAPKKARRPALFRRADT
jgi:phytanoyl-CoA hydroxylase